MESICALCRTRAKLCRSHIIPEFLYRPLYDEKHRYSVIRVGQERVSYAQHGLKEPLLCHACEQRISQRERYAADVMTGRRGHRFHERDGRIIVTGIDYSSFKLFQLSILWRASVTTLDFFKLVSLGAHEAKLRRMLQDDDPGKPEDYGCVVVFATEGGEDISDTFFNPEPLRWAGHRMMKFFFAGSAWLFHCDSQAAPPYLRGLFLQSDGSLAGLAGDLADARLSRRTAMKVARRAGVMR